MADQNMANQRLQEILEQEQKKLREELNASNFLKEINNPERKRWFRSQPYEKMPDKLYKILNDPLVKYITDLNSSNKERILKATSKEKLKQEIDNLKNKIAASPRYDLKYAGLLEGPFAAKPRISGAVEWSIKFLTVIAIAIAIAAIVITSSAGLGITPFLISSLVAVPACYAAMRFTRGWMFGTQQNDLLRTSTLELELETFQAKIKALGEQQKFFRDDTEGKKYVKNLTKTLNSDLVQTYSTLSDTKTNKEGHIQNKLLKYGGNQITLNQLKANLTTLFDTNEFVEFNKDNQTLKNKFNLDFDKNERVIQAVKALFNSKLAEKDGKLDLSAAEFLTLKDGESTYIISGNKVYLYANGEVTDTELVVEKANANKKIAIYEELRNTKSVSELQEYVTELNSKVTAKGTPSIKSILNALGKVYNSPDKISVQDVKKYNKTLLSNIPLEQIEILTDIAQSTQNLTPDSSGKLCSIISNIYTNPDIEGPIEELQANNEEQKSAATKINELLKKLKDAVKPEKDSGPATV
ncbi:MAG: hypothetical protein ACO2XZ_01330, partial [Rickettsiales bacterium]